MRDAFITFNERDGFYTITLRELQFVKETRRTNNYHQIGTIVVNWIRNGF